MSLGDDSSTVAESVTVINEANVLPGTTRVIFIVGLLGIPFGATPVTKDKSGSMEE